MVRNADSDGKIQIKILRFLLFEHFEFIFLGLCKFCRDRFYRLTPAENSDTGRRLDDD